MTNNRFTRKALGLLLVPLALSSLPATAHMVEVSEMMSSSISGANFEGDSHYGFRFGFYIDPEAMADGNATEAVLCGFMPNWWTNQSNATSLEMPDYVRVYLNDEYVSLPVNKAVLTFSAAETSFPDQGNMRSVIFPANYTNIELAGNFDGQIRNFHFRTETVPEILVSEEAKKNVRLYAPAALAESYNTALAADGLTVTRELEAVLNEESGMWDTNVTITDEAGNVFGIHVNDLNWDVRDSYDPETGDYIGSKEYHYVTSDYQYLVGFSTAASSVTLPENAMLKIEDQEIPLYMYRFELTDHNLEENSFKQSPDLTDVYVPANYTDLNWYGPYANTEALNYHLNSETIPNISIDYSEAAERINFYVPDELFALYSAAWPNRMIWSDTPATPVSVNVSVPGLLADTAASVIEDLANVRWLIITGTPNEFDLRLLRRMTRLETLDLSGTTGIETMSGCTGLKYLKEVVLPEGMTAIGANAFEECRNLNTINFPNSLVEIKGNAFSYAGLESISLPATVKSIGYAAFYGNTRLRTANLENVEIIDSEAFYNCDLRSVNLSNLSYVNGHVFNDNYNLSDVVWGEKITTIGSYAFSSCPLQEIILPKSVTYIESGAFNGDSDFDRTKVIKRVELGENIEHIDRYAFDYRTAETVICHAVFPLDEDGFDGCDITNATLYVPALTLNEYMLSEAYINFIDIQPLEEDLINLTIDREYTLKSDSGIADKANLTLLHNGGYMDNGTGSLTVSRNADLNLGKYIQYGSMSSYGEYWDDYYGWRYWYGYEGATIIPESKVTAEEAEIHITLRTNEWQFMAFPFDVNVKDIVVDEDALWVVRKYSGSDRAELNENTWQNMTDETILNAGVGYIFHCTKENGDMVNFTFRPASNNAFFSNEAVSTPLDYYPSEFAHNASWNLVGNTYPAYVNIKGLDFEAPITIWENGTYRAYSPIDDELALNPFQAFFVQRQDIDGGDVLSINPTARAHSREGALALDMTPALAPARAARLGSAPRSLFNLTVKGENGTDRARIVVNETADMAYETFRDASKFMSTDANVPQIYVMNGNVRMAIDERPLADGEFTLGAYFGDNGEYTLSLGTRNADSFTVLLTDNATGITTDITSIPYVFKATKGTDNGRFTLRISGTQTGVEAVEAAEGVKVSVEGNVLSVVAPEAVEIMVANAEGMVVASDKSADFSVVLPTGVYVVKAGEKVTKVAVK